MSDQISSFVRLPKKHSQENLQKRKEWIKQKTGIDWNDNDRNSPEDFEGILENHLGFINMPIGIASPLLIVDGVYAKGEYVVPLVTLEGSLVSSMSRGMLASYRSGGIKTTHIKQSVSRSPIFMFSDFRKAKQFMNWVDTNYENIKKICNQSSRFGRLLSIDKYPIQDCVVLDFIFYTANAAGQNMVSLATLEGCKYINEKTNSRFFLESNFSGDKKHSQLNILRGRGHYVMAETQITNSVLKRVLGSDVKSFLEMYELGMQASVYAGTSGIQLHLANALAGIFLATGQDVACVAENSIGFSQIRQIKDGIRFILTMPSLTVGTVGGGTRLSQQQKNLKMLGCINDENSSKKLAEIICAAAMCLEISLLSAIVSGSWVDAHMRYGRNRIPGKSNSKN